ncbi:MAG: metallophosphoesterase [Candidatus Hodarchaeales archaeon]|jgi:hypothetical protein
MDFSVPYSRIPAIEEIVELTTSFIKKLVKEPTVVDIPANSSVLYVGDLHGYFNSLETALKLADENNVEYVVFLGDYVDKGPKQIETIVAILELALRDERFVPLRGNHENEDQNRLEGLYSEIVKHYSNLHEEEQVFDTISITYEFFPLAALRNGTLAVHAGIPENPDFELVRRIPKPHSRLLAVTDKETRKELYSILNQIRWNDPQTWLFKSEEERLSLEKQVGDVIKFSFSKRGKRMRLFSKGALIQYLEKNKLTRLVRAHESSRGAYENVWNGKLIHVFSAYPYGEQIMEGRYLLQHENSKNNTVIDVLSPVGDIIDSIL